MKPNRDDIKNAQKRLEKLGENLPPEKPKLIVKKNNRRARRAWLHVRARFFASKDDQSGTPFTKKGVHHKKGQRRQIHHNQYWPTHDPKLTNHKRNLINRELRRRRMELHREAK